jgi:hypothetical protein
MRLRLLLAAARVEAGCECLSMFLCRRRQGGRQQEAADTLQQSTVQRSTAQHSGGPVACSLLLTQAVWLDVSALQQCNLHMQTPATYHAFAAPASMHLSFQRLLSQLASMHCAVSTE